MPRLPWYFIPASLVLLLATEVELLTLLHYNAAPELWDLALPNLKYMALAFCVVLASWKVVLLSLRSWRVPVEMPSAEEAREPAFCNRRLPPVKVVGPV